MKVRRLTPSGVEGFSAYLALLASDPRVDPPMRLLEDPQASEPINPEIDAAERSFQTRFDAAAYLHAQIAPHLKGWNRDVGLWAWLTLRYFDQVCPRGTKAGEVARYIPQVNVARRAYRHALLGPVSLYHANADDPERLRGLLSSPMPTTAQTYHLFSENPRLASCKAIVQLATDLYFDSAKGTIRRGAGSKDSGGCRRLVDFLQQIDCTFDLASLDTERLVEMLPGEFHRFLPKQQRM